MEYFKQIALSDCYRHDSAVTVRRSARKKNNLPVPQSKNSRDGAISSRLPENKRYEQRTYPIVNIVITPAFQMRSLRLADPAFRRTASSDCAYGFYFRNRFLDNPLYDRLKSDRRARASAAGALETDVNNIIRCVFYEFNVSAVPLQKRFNLFDAALNVCEDFAVLYLCLYL